MTSLGGLFIYLEGLIFGILRYFTRFIRRSNDGLLYSTR